MLKKVQQKYLPVLKSLRHRLFIYSFFLFFLLFFFMPQRALGFPIYAQQAYENPREPNGKIVCANCHLAKKPMELELPAAILPNSVFEAILRVSVDSTKKQILESGKRGALNIGAILIMPEGFKLAPKNLINNVLKEKIKGLQIIPYSPKNENMLVVGPIAPKNSGLSTNKSEIMFPILAPDPRTNISTHFIKYSMYAGLNQGRAQINPNGEKTNNNGISAETSGEIGKITRMPSKTIITILGATGNPVKTQVIPEGLSFTLKEKQLVRQDELLTEDPNIGGFGQTEAAIVLQNPTRIYVYLIFCIFVAFTQLLFVLKKKQFEKVQLVELEFMNNFNK